MNLGTLSQRVGLIVVVMLLAPSAGAANLWQLKGTGPFIGTNAVPQALLGLVEIRPVLFICP